MTDTVTRPKTHVRVWTLIGAIIGFLVALGIVHLSRVLGANFFSFGSIIGLYIKCIILFTVISFFYGMYRRSTKLWKYKQATKVSEKK